MARLLDRLGRFGARRAWTVVLAWLVILAAMVGALTAFGGSLTNGVSIPGTETERVTQQLEKSFPELTGGTGQVVFSSDHGAFTKDQQAAIGRQLSGVGKLDGVKGAMSPFAPPTPQTVSEDQTVAVGTIMFDADTYDIPERVHQDVVDALEHADIPGVDVSYSSTIAMQNGGLLGATEVIGVLIAVLVLVVMMRALLPAMIPLIGALVGVGVAVAGSMAFSGVIDMSETTPLLGVMLGLAVGIDYALFIVNRHRRQLAAGTDLHTSIGRANGTAGTAVVFAGTTVVIALLALNVVGIPFLGVMGTVGALGVAIAVLVAITLTPALLGLIGPRVLGRGSRRQHEDAESARRPMRTGRAIAIALVSVLALAALAIPAFAMRLGLPDGSAEPVDSPQYRAQELIGQKFGAGTNGPLLVLADLPAPVDKSTAAQTQQQLTGTLMKQDDVAGAAPLAVSEDGTSLVFQVIPDDGPNSQSTERLVHSLRALSPLDGGIHLGVAGQTSGNIDVSTKLADALPIYLAVVVGLSLLILIVVFRSLLLPLIATAGYVLSLGAALGALTAIFQWGWLSSIFGVHDPGPVLSFGPILLMGVLFGLAMDYQIFLATGMREAYAHGTSARAAVTAGVRNGRGVVTAAAIIMTAVFGGFVFSDLALIRPIGFGLAIGVLFDAFIVRMLLVPAIMTFLGEAAWWLPGWANRLLPHIDVEGSALKDTAPAVSSTAKG
ncbi:MMPL family transporter [Amycolatopsis ultiminotia]|uniref:MMPL family transporter n=1 Tax=Amycolatopsis ultiminotia TaxID=543629 RepID=A0ABP6W226_9PSEU